MGSNYHMASLRNKDVPLNAEKFLFSLDVVHYVMSNRWSEYADIPIDMNDSESYRDSVYNGFTGIIVDAVRLLIERLRDAADQKFANHLANNNAVTTESFYDYVRDYEREYFLGGDYNKRNFLKFFVSVALAAGHYHSQNVTEARQTAVNILTLWFPPTHFINSVFWDDLAEVAREIVEGRVEEPAVEPVNQNLIDYIETN